MLTQRNLSIRQILCLAAVLVFGILAATAWTILQFRQDTLARRKTELDNTAELLTASLDQDFKSLELVQLSVADFFRASPPADGSPLELMKSPAVRSLLMEKISLLPNITGASIFSDTGKLVNATRVWPIPDASLSDAKFFQSIKESEAGVGTVSPLIPNFIDGAPIFMIARKLTSPTGDFIGAVASGFGTKYLSRTIGLPSLTKENSITLFREDGVILARYPSPSSHGGSSSLNDPALSTPPTESLSAERKLTTLPLKVVVSVPKALALEEWRRQTQLHLVTALLMVLLVCTIFAAILRRLQRNYGNIEQMIRRERNLLDTAINSMSHGLVMYSPDSRILIINQKYLKMYGLSGDAAKPGITFRDLIALRKKTGTFSGDVDSYCSAIQDDIHHGRAARILATTRDGRIVQISNSPIEGGGWIALLEDITEQRQTEIERDRSKKFLDQIIDQVPVTIIVKKAIERTFVLVNRQAESLWGLPRSEAIGRTSREMFSADQADVIDSADNAVLASDKPLLLEAHPSMVGGKKRIVTSKRSTVQDEAGNPQYIISVVEDVTERLEAESRITHLAYHDALTELPNRASFHERLEELFGAANGKNFALLYIDLDNFKGINDSLGHLAGDALLKNVADRLRACTTDGEFVARLSGDEFAIVKTGFDHTNEITDLLKRISSAFETPCDIFGRHLQVQTSIGIAIAPADGSDIDTLLKNADLALYGAKADGRNTFRFFEEKMDARIKERRTLEADLRKAIAEEEFEVHYQPIVDLKSGAIASCEALLRWRHPERGLVSPGTFIPVAEECGLITQIGEWVLRRACHEAVEWPEDIRVAVNVSSVQFRSQELVSTVSSVLANSGLPAGRLEIELTESVFVRDDEQALHTLNRLREMGVRIAMDDFGTGYSSLSYLKRFPFDKIKIDRSFIHDIAESDQARTIIQAVVAIAKSRDIATTAEGVETREQREFLAAMGCTEMQGFLYSTAKPARAIRKMLTTSTSSAAA